MTNYPEPTSEVVLGIDYGSTNIGVAFGCNGFVKALGIVNGKNNQTALSELAKLAIEHKATKLVFGLPLTFDGKETAQSQKTRVFAKLLKLHLKLKTQQLVFISEYASTKEALASAISHGVSKKDRQAIDQFSAALIVKRYFDELA